jgi:hypothetical protein
MYSYHCSLLKASIPTPTAQCQWSPIPRTDHTQCNLTTELKQYNIIFVSHSCSSDKTGQYLDMSTLINLLPLSSVAVMTKLPQTVLCNQNISFLQICQHQLEPIHFT